MNSRQQVINRHASTSHLTRRTRNIARQPRPRRIRQPQHADWRFHRLAGDVDHPSPSARRHHRQQCFHQRNRGQHIRVERADKIITVPIRPQTRRRPTRVGHQNIDLPSSFNRGALALFSRHICCQRGHLDAMRLADGLRRSLKRLCTARIHHKIDPCCCQSLCTSQAQALTRGTDQRPLAVNSKIHSLFLTIKGCFKVSLVRNTAQAAST